MNGWIKLHRSMLEWEWYDDWPCFRLFMHLLLTVNRKPTRYRGYDIPAGARVCGYPALAEQTGLSIKQVRSAVNKLKETGEVAVRKTNKFSIISITNWSRYQEEGQSNGMSEVTSEGSQRADKGQQNGEGKKGRKEENTRARAREPDGFDLKPDGVDEQTWRDFLKLRKAKKAPITSTAVKMLKTEADKAGWSLQSAVEEAVARGWQSFKAHYVADQKSNSSGKQPVCL